MSSYAHQFDNLYEKDQFLERYNLSKLTQEEINYLYRLISIKEMEWISNTFQNRKLQAQMGSLVNSSKHLRKKIITILCNCFQRIETEWILPNKFHETSIILI